MTRYLSKLLPGLLLIAMMPLTVTVTRADEKKDIVDTALSAGSFKTLAAALTAADLVDALKGKGPFTVFAPTDEAFAKLPAGTVETLVKPENKDQLIAILKYHVVPGDVRAKQVVTLNGATTLNGQRVDIRVVDGSVKVDSATVVATDVECTNGVIHVIDNVILPSSDDIVATASSAGSFGTLLAAAQAAGLVDALKSKGPLTVFAPTDEAFAKLPAGTVESLLKPANKQQLADILKFHVVPGRVYSTDARKAKQAKTLQGSTVRFRIQGDAAKVQEANLVTTDIDASNGVIHVIDSVMLPPAAAKVSAAEACTMIEQTVRKGARLYNTGHHRACAQVYMTATVQMLETVDHMPETVTTNLKHLVNRAQHTTCPTQRSWTLRAGLDHAYAQMKAH